MRRSRAVEALRPEIQPMQQEDWADVARALNRLADGVEAIRPAADTIHGFGDRLDALCRWLKGRWPWITMIGILLLNRTVNAAPNEFPQLVRALSGFLRSFT